MRSHDDLDRVWTSAEIAELSEKELAALAFRRDLKNLGLFVPVAGALYLIAANFGTPGRALGWIGILVFSVFVLQNLMGVFLGLGGVIRTTFVQSKERPPELMWRSVQLLISLVNSVAYGLLALAVYLAIASA